MSGRSITLGDRLGVAGRVALAAFGGYGIAALSTALLALALPLARAEAVTAGTLASFAIMAGCVVWTFAALSLARAALGLGAAAGLLAIGLWLVGGLGSGGGA